MTATPWIDALAAIDDRLSGVADARQPTAAEPWDAAESVVTQLCRLAEAAATDRFPRLSHSPDRETDRAVRAVLDARLAAESVPEWVPLESLAGRGRIDRTGGRIVVPLEGCPANWYVVYPWAGDRLSVVAENCGRVAGRCDAVGAGPLAATFRDLATGMGEFAGLLSWLPTITLWQSPPAELVDAPYREIESFAKRTLDATSHP